MPRHRYGKQRASANAFGAWLDLATRSTEMLWASAEVIARRSYQLGTATPATASRDARETRRMVDEKVHASTDSMIAMSFRSFEIWQAMVFRPWPTGTLSGAVDNMVNLAQASADVMAAGLTPFHRKTRSNVKRLRR
jgi:hypothetical protein